MRNPEFSHSEEALKEEAWKILNKETEPRSLVDVLIYDMGIRHPDRIKDIREYVHDQVLEEIIGSGVALLDFCSSKGFRRSIYQNKINDVCRRGIPPFVDVTSRDARKSKAPGQGTRHFRTIDQGSIEVGNFLPRLEAVDELSAIIQKVRDPKYQQRFEIMLEGVVMGWSNQEILDEWEKVEGKRLSDARVSQTYLIFRDKYLRKKFPNSPHSFEEFRALVHPIKKERAVEKAKDVSRYHGILSKELTRLLHEERTSEVGEEVLVIEYLLGRRPYNDLVSSGLSTTRKVMLVKDRISAYSGVPFQYLKFSVLNGRNKHV